MPQTLSDEWKVYLGNDWSDIHTQWLDTAGNLTLSGYNPELGTSLTPRNGNFRRVEFCTEQVP